MTELHMQRNRSNRSNPCKMPRILLFEDTNRIFLHSSNGRLKVLFEDSNRIFLHSSEVDPKCTCEGKVENCICKDLDIVIRIKDDSPTELLQVSGWYLVNRNHAKMPKVILFEDTSRVFVHDSKECFKVFFEDPYRVFMHTSTEGFKCSCDKKVKNCICMGCNIVIRTKIHLQGLQDCDLSDW